MYFACNNYFFYVSSLDLGTETIFAMYFLEKKSLRYVCVETSSNELVSVISDINVLKACPIDCQLYPFMVSSVIISVYI